MPIENPSRPPCSPMPTGDLKYLGVNWFLLDRQHPDPAVRSAVERVLVEIGGYRPSGVPPEGKKQTANGKNQKGRKGKAAPAANSGRPGLDELPRFMVLLPELSGDDELLAMHLDLYEAFADALQEAKPVLATPARIRRHVRARRGFLAQVEGQETNVEQEAEAGPGAEALASPPAAGDPVAPEALAPEKDPVSDFLARLTPEQLAAVVERGLEKLTPKEQGSGARGEGSGTAKALASDAARRDPVAPNLGVAPKQGRAAKKPEPGARGSAPVLDEETLKDLEAAPKGTTAGPEGDGAEGQVQGRFSGKKRGRRSIAGLAGKVYTTQGVRDA